MTSQHFFPDTFDDDLLEGSPAAEQNRESTPELEASATRVGLVGSTAETPISEVLKDIAQRELSGDLQIVSGRAKRTIYFDRGFIVFAGSNLKTDRLGQRLLESGRLTAAELESAFLLTKPSKRLGQALVETGILSEEELEREVVRQAKRIALCGYVLKEATYSFDERECIIPMELRLGISVYRIQLEGIRRMANGHLIHRVLGSLARPVRAVEIPPFSFKDAELQALERKVVELAKEPTPLRQIVESSGGHVDDVLRAAYGLVCANVIEYADSSRGPRKVQEESGTFLLSSLEKTRVSAPTNVRQEVLLQFDSLEELPAEKLLEVDASADIEDIERAYEKRREEWRKKQALLICEKSLFVKVEEIQRRLTQAHRRLIEAKNESNDEHQNGGEAATADLDAIEIPIGDEIEIPIEDEEDIPIDLEDEDPGGIAAIRDDRGIDCGTAPEGLDLAEVPLDTELGDWGQATAAPAPPREAVSSEREATEKTAGASVPSEPTSPADRLKQLLYDVKIRKAVNDQEGAISLMYEVVELMPNSAKYEALLADALASHPVLSKRAERHYRRALFLDPQDANLHYRLGRYYDAFNMKSRALAEYKTALRIDPRHTKARAALVGDGAKKAGAAGQLFKHLFG